MLRSCLDDLSRRIDERQEQHHRQQWHAFVHGQWKQDVFAPMPRKPAPPQVNWPAISVNTAFNDFEAMLLQQLGGCSRSVDGGAAPLNVRCNYGTSIIPSLFGVELFMMAEEANTLPTSHPLRSTDAIRRLVDAGVPDIHRALGSRTFAMAEQFVDVLDKYPVLGRNIEIYHPDAQGPIDIAEVIWGSEIFYAFGDEPQLLHDFLQIITQTYINFMRHWYKLVPPKWAFSTHWNTAHMGRLMLRNDSLMNLPPDLYIEFVRPMDQKLFDEFGGGAIHFCGRGDHFIEPMSQMRGLTAVNLSQPELNNMATIYQHTVDKGIKIIALRRAAAQAAGRPLHGRVHVT